MPLSNFKIEVQHCLDAKHADEELRALVEGLYRTDVALERDVTGEAPASRVVITTRVLDENLESNGGDGLWKGRVTGYISMQTHNRAGERALAGADDSDRFDITIPHYGGWTLLRTVGAKGQADGFEDIIRDDARFADLPEDTLDEIVAAGRAAIIEALMNDLLI